MTIKFDIMKLIAFVMIIYAIAVEEISFFLGLILLLSISTLEIVLGKRGQ